MPKPTYDPSGLYWVESMDLGQINLDDEAFLAEAILGIHGTTYSGTDALQLKVAVAQQVAFQVAQGISSRLYIEERRGQRTYEFSGAANKGVDPVAAKIVEQVTGHSPDPISAVSNSVIVMTHANQDHSGLP